MRETADERASWLSKNVLHHEAALRGWLYSRKVVGLDVDDIVQETYARLIAVDSVSDIRNVRSYMFQTAHSVIKSYLRRSKIVKLQTVSDFDSLGQEAKEATPEEELIGRDELKRLAVAIADLPDRIRDVFVMRRVRGLSQRETAEALGLSENTIEKHMTRCLLRLSSLFSYSRKSRTHASNGLLLYRSKKDDSRTEKQKRSGN